MNGFMNILEDLAVKTAKLDISNACTVHSLIRRNF